mmetsp:Transcript_124909/g.361306  ORF Transcript_124909/g.361306 Transcript_124909/m.361306 type:complete len:294 (-) Transcript_124909:1983-2864(-)
MSTRRVAARPWATHPAPLPCLRHVPATPSGVRSGPSSNTAVALADGGRFRTALNATRARQFPGGVLALENGHHHDDTQRQGAHDREDNVADRRLVLVTAELAIQEEALIHCLVLFDDTPGQQAAIERLDGAVAAVCWKISLEVAPLCGTQRQRLLEHEPLRHLLATWCRVASLVADEGAVHRGPQGPHQVDGLTKDGVFAFLRRQVTGEQLLQQLALFAHVEQETGDQHIVVLKLYHALLVLVDHLQLSRILPAINHVLGRHAQPNIRHLIVFWITVRAGGEREVTELVARHR